MSVLKFVLFFSCFLKLSPLQGTPQHGIAMHGDLKYPADFSHFEGVNPEAPKRGELKIALIGTFDTLNPFILKGTAPPGIREICFESLLKRSPDEPFSLYGLVAESIEIAPDRSWIIFNINPKARWHDGHPITAKDIEFSYRTLKDYGPPASRLTLQKVDSVTVLRRRKIKFIFKKIEGRYDTEMPLIMGIMSLFAEHDLRSKNFEKTGFTPLLGSGPYKIEKAVPGHSILYKKDPTYWARNLPVNKGFYNFETLRFDFYKNETAALEAFKAGDVDLWEETDPVKWKKITSQHTFPAVQKGHVRCIEISHHHPVGMKAFVFNTRRDIFQDPRVRQALIAAFDYEWVNQILFGGALTRSQSFFDNTELAAKDLPLGKELALLELFRAQLSWHVFECPYILPSFKKESQKNTTRENLKLARGLLQDAGWNVKNGKLIHTKTGNPFIFEIILGDPEDEKIALSFVRNLKPLGIDVSVRTVDAAQYATRQTHKNFDMIIHTWGHTLSPGNEQIFYWSTKAADAPGTRNYPGIKSPIIDALCRAITQAKTREDLIVAVRALDRVLLWGHYVIPLGYSGKDYLAYWTHIDFPPPGPLGFPSFHGFWMREKSKSSPLTHSPDH